MTYKENPAITSILGKIGDVIINPLIELLFGVALLIFLYGVFEYFIKSGEAEARKTGGQHILWGLIGMLIMFGVYGIIRIITGTFGIEVPGGLL